MNSEEFLHARIIGSLCQNLKGYADTSGGSEMTIKVGLDCLYPNQPQEN